MKYKNEILEVLEMMGIYIDDADSELNLQEYIIDSLQFITFIVNLEEKLEFTFPDEYLIYESIGNINILNDIIEQVKK